MNNQEAIEVMFNEWKCIDRNDGINCDRKCESCDLVMDVQTIREAFNIAISALQAQEAKHSKELSPTHKALDTISRQAAIDALDKRFDSIPMNQTTEILLLRKDLRELPSVQPERKKGRWLPDNRPDGGFWVCSCCKFPSEAFAADKLYKYCPVCGADMREEDT